MGLLKAPLVDVTVCGMLSWLVHVTVPPTEIVTVRGEKDLFASETLAFAGAGGGPGGGWWGGGGGGGGAVWWRGGSPPPPPARLHCDGAVLLRVVLVLVVDV